MTRASTNASSISEKPGDNQQASTDEKPCMSDKHKMKNGKSDSGNTDKQEHDKQIAQKASPSRGYQQQSPSKGQKVNL